MCFKLFYIGLFLYGKFEDTLAEVGLTWLQVCIAFCPILVRRVGILLAFQTETCALVVNNTLLTGSGAIEEVT